MKILTLAISLILFNTMSFSQKTERYSGVFFNGQDVKGDANFSYYTDNKNNQIKSGSFRYSAREKNKNWHYSHNINGKYNEGMKIGKWSYTLNSKEKKIDKEGYFYDITVNLTANYNKGIPEGQWEYSCYIFKYKKEMVSGRPRKTKKNIIKDLNITLNWNNGKLTDSLIIIDKVGEKIIVPMNEYGVIKGTMIIANKTENTIIDYDKGVETRYIYGQDTIESLEYTTYITIEDKKAKVKKLKNSYLYRESCIIEDYIIDNIFNNEYFLYKYIEGDKLLKSDKTFGDYTVSLKGLYYYDLTPIPTIEENNIFTAIEVADVKTKEAYWFNKKALKKNPKNKKLLEDKQIINSALNEYSTLKCHLNIYKKYLNLQNIKNKANCNSLHFAIPPNTRFEYLQQIKHQSDIQYKNLSLNNLYH